MEQDTYLPQATVPAPCPANIIAGALHTVNAPALIEMLELISTAWAAELPAGELEVKIGHGIRLLSEPQLIKLAGLCEALGMPRPLPEAEQITSALTSVQTQTAREVLSLVCDMTVCEAAERRANLRRQRTLIGAFEQVIEWLPEHSLRELAGVAVHAYAASHISCN